MQEPIPKSYATIATKSVGHQGRSHESAASLQALCAQLHHRVSSFLAEKTEVALLQNVQNQTRTSLQVAQEALSKYAFEELCMSYNGGKDCLVLLVIYLAALHTHFSSRLSISGDSDASATTNGLSESHEAASSHFPNSVKCVYIQPAHPFSEVDDFVHNSAADYHLDLATSHKPMKAAFAEYLQDHTEVRAIFVGTRRTDPHGASLTHFDPTDRGWPSFMRIHPVIDWHYQEIWAFIRHLQIPYCQLYDMGYTSLGGTNNTHPNPKLGVAQQDGSGQMTGQIIFRPAYELQDDHEERLGRS
ncbi:MAG: hypothetical protein Q9159_007315 [Coniocarpon cinnabarinum]